MLDRLEEWVTAVGLVGQLPEMMQLFVHALTGEVVPLRWVEEHFLTRPLLPGADPAKRNGARLLCDPGFRYVEHAPWGRHHRLEACIPSSLAPRKRPTESPEEINRVRAATRLDMTVRPRGGRAPCSRFLPRFLLSRPSRAQLFIEAQQLFKRQQLVLRAFGSNADDAGTNDEPPDEEAKAALAPPPAPPRRVQGFGGLSFADLCAIEATAGRARLDGCEDHQSDP